MSRVKVFYFIPNLQQGGPERQILELIRRLPARFEPILCLYHNEVFYRDALPADQPRHVLGVPRMNLAALDRLTEILRQERPTIVHTYRDKSNFWARIAALRAGVPIIVSACRNRMMQLRYLMIERALSQRCQLILTNSQGVKHELVSWARVNPDKVRVIYNFLDTSQFRPPTPAERAAARSAWRLEAGQRVLLLPGRIGLQKHQAGLLLALKQLAQRGSLPEQTLLLLAGRRRDRQISALVGWLSRRPQLRTVVREVGAQRDIRSLYWAADLLVMPSLYEGLPNAAMEACACGLPAILSRAANVDQILVHGETGLEVPTGRQSALRQALERMLGLSDTALSEMGRRSAEHVAQRFAPHADHVLQQMVAVYDELLAKGS